MAISTTYRPGIIYDINNNITGYSFAPNTMMLLDDGDIENAIREYCIKKIEEEADKLKKAFIVSHIKGEKSDNA